MHSCNFIWGAGKTSRYGLILALFGSCCGKNGKGEPFFIVLLHLLRFVN